MASRKTFPNNYDEVFATPSEAFASIPYEDFMEMALMWHIPSSHCCIMRVEHKKTGKITEHAYQRLSAAKNKLLALGEDRNYEVLVADDDSIALFKARPPFDYADEFDDPFFS